MSNKQQAIKNLKNAKTAHLQWRARAQALVAGVEMNGEQVPVGHHDCKFGHWYDGSINSPLGSLQTFRALEVPHKTLHKVYSKIFDVLEAADQKPSTLQKLFGQSNQADHEEVKRLVDDMIEVSKTLLLAIKHLEDELAEMSDGEYDALKWSAKAA